MSLTRAPDQPGEQSRRPPTTGCKAASGTPDSVYTTEPRVLDSVDRNSSTEFPLPSNSGIPDITEGIFKQKILTKGSNSENSGLLSGLFSMKFPKPKMLTENEYPDLDTSHPDLIRKLVQEIVHPEEGSKMSKYYETAIEFLKDQKRSRAKKTQNKMTKVHFTELGRKLYFLKCATWGRDPLIATHFSALIDTDAANSLLHISVVEKLTLELKQQN